MPTVDNLDIQIASSAQQANKAIDSIIKNLGRLSDALKLDTSKLSNIGKNLGFENAGKSISQSMKQAQKSLNETSDKAKELSNIKLLPLSEITPALSQLDLVKQKMLGLEKAGLTTSDLYKRVADEVKRLELESKNTKIDVNTNEIKQKIDELRQKFETYGMDFKFTGNSEQLNVEIEKIYSNLNELREKEKEIISSGDINTSGFEYLQKQIAETGNKFGILQDLRDRTEEFNQVLSRLKVPEVREENLTKLQNTLRKTEEEVERLRIKLENSITKGEIAPNVDDGKFRKLAEQIALSEKQAEALRNKIEEVGKTSSKTNILSDAIKKLNSNTNTLSKSMNGLGKNITSAFSGVKSFTRQILSAVGIVGGLYGAIRGIKTALDISSQLTEVQNVVDVTFGDMAQKVENFAKTSIEQFGMSELSLKQYASRFQAMGSAMGIGTSAISKANEKLSQLTNGYVSASDSMADVSLNLTKLTADMASFYDVEQETVAQALASGIMGGQTRPLRQYGLDLTQATLQEWALKQGLDANVQSMSQAEKTMLRYQYVMANTTAAQGDFARTANTWANQVRILKQNFQQLAAIIGGVLVNAFKPLIQALNAAMSHIISFAQTISNALGKIFGWTYEKGGGGIAQDFEGAADASDDIANSTGAAAKNIKKMQAGLRAFDELKTINMPDDADGTSGGGTGKGTGAAGGAGGSGGKWVAGETIFEKYKSDISNLYDLGKYIGDTLSKEMESINWQKVYKKARNFGTGLAQFLNGLISPELFEALGRTIASSLNTALYFLNSFGETFDWENFGLSIATGINEFFKTFDFKAAADTINIWLKGVLTTVTTLLKETDFEQIGNKIGEFLKELDFLEIAGDLAEAIWEAIKAGFDLLKGLFEEAPLETSLIVAFGVLKFTKLGSFVAKKIGDAIALSISSGTFGTSIATALQTTIAKSLIGVTAGVAIGTAVGKLVDNYIMAPLMEALGDEEMAKAYKDFSWFGEDGFFETLKSSIEDGSWKDALALWKEDIKTFLTGIGLLQDPVENIKNIGDELKKEWEEISGYWKGKSITIKAKCEDFKKKVQNKWEDAKKYWKDKTPLEEIKTTYQSFKDKISEKWNLAQEYWKNKNPLGEVKTTYQNFKDKVKEKWTLAKDWWNNNKPDLKEVSAKFADFAAGLKNAWQAAVNWWDNNKPNLSDITANIKLPHLEVTWDVNGFAAKALQKLGLKGFPNFAVKYYATGGFPEDGWFRANHGEIMGKFDNGQSVVANNKQITQGISLAVQEGNRENNSLMRQEISLLQRQNDILMGILDKEFGITKKQIGEAARDYSIEYMQRTGSPAYKF